MRPPARPRSRRTAFRALGSLAALACALAALGEDRVLFSVDYPFEDCKVAAGFIESAPVDRRQLRKLCHENAERVLGLKLGGSRAAA